MLITSIPQYIQGLTNAKVDLTNTNDTVLYTAPSDSDFNASVINSLLVSNDSGSAGSANASNASNSSSNEENISIPSPTFATLLSNIYKKCN